MTQSEIDKKIRAESDAFNNKVYDGPELPEGIMYLFIKGMMQSAPSDPYWTKTIINKSAEELTWKEAGIVINFLRKLPYAWFFDDINEAVDYHINLNELTSKYNEIMAELTAELDAKKERMYKLSGINNNGNSNILKMN